VAGHDLALLNDTARGDPLTSALHVEHNPTILARPVDDLLKDGALADAKRSVEEDRLGGLASESELLSLLQLLDDSHSILAKTTMKVSHRTGEKGMGASMNIPNEEGRVVGHLELSALNLASPTLRDELLLLPRVEVKVLTYPIKQVRDSHKREHGESEDTDGGTSEGTSRVGGSLDDGLLIG